MMMLDDLFDEVDLGSGKQSPRAQLIGRIVFGLIGCFLGLAGCYKFLTEESLSSNAALRVCMITTFAMLTAFCLFNVIFARQWRWPGIGFVLSFAGVFIARIVGGA